MGNGVDIAFHSLIDGDVLFYQSRNFIGLLGLDSGDPLLHQVATLHVQEEGTIVRLHFPRRNDLSEGVMKQRFMSDQVKKADSVFVQSKDVFRSFPGIAFTTYLYIEKSVYIIQGQLFVYKSLLFVLRKSAVCL